MYSIADAVVTYKPGEGYTATMPGGPATIRWGDEFWAQVKAKQQALAAAQKEKPAETPPARR